MTDDKKNRLEQALLDPASIFDQPSDVVADRELSRKAKVEVLRRWESDAHQLSVATEENMPSRDGTKSDNAAGLLERVLAALHELGEGAVLEDSPPTKTGG